MSPSRNCSSVSGYRARGVCVCCNSEWWMRIMVFVVRRDETIALYETVIVPEKNPLLYYNIIAYFGVGTRRGRIFPTYSLTRYHTRVPAAAVQSLPTLCPHDYPPGAGKYNNIAIPVTEKPYRNALIDGGDRRFMNEIFKPVPKTRGDSLVKFPIRVRYYNWNV